MNWVNAHYFATVNTQGTIYLNLSDNNNDHLCYEMTLLFKEINSAGMGLQAYFLPTSQAKPCFFWLQTKKHAPDIFNIWEMQLKGLQDYLKPQSTSNEILLLTYHTEHRQAASALRYRSNRKLCSSVFYMTNREMSM